jgi:hypothetical protein
MLKSGYVLFSLLFVAPLASAEIFKCVGKRGETLYQNFPCESESIAWGRRMSPPPRNQPSRGQSRASA